MRPILRAATALAVVCLVACKPLATVPDLHAPVPPQYRHAPTSTDARAPDLQSWWHAFGDARLDAIVTQALQDNAGLAQAQARLRAARALAKASGVQFLPEVHFNSLTTPDPDATASYLQINIDAQWEMGLFGRAPSTRRIEQAGIDAAAADQQGARVSLVAEVVRDYLTLRGTQRQTELLEAIRDATATRDRLMRRRRELGLATASELAHADAELAQAAAALVEPRARADASAQQLAVLCGLPEPPAEWLATAPLPKLDAVAPAVVPADLLRTRPDIHRAEAAVLAAAGELGVARADLYPRLSLLGGMTASSITGGGEFGFGRAVPAIGPIIDIPLFDWGARRARANARDAELAAAVQAYRQTVLEAVGETETALAAWQAQGERSDRIGAVVAARTRELEAIDAAHRHGLADRADQAAATIVLAQARLDLLEAQQARSLAYVALYKALGGAPMDAGAH
ncbi:MAG: efflux transporter outer membrane subunit [Proteobacteria bacterium]|nr:efflux transporter outer membrane subunit [Pseudomonadota bacterium]